MKCKDCPYCGYGRCPTEPYAALGLSDIWTCSAICSYYVLMHGPGDPRALRLLDLEPHETVTVGCRCGRSVDFPNGFLQRRYRVPSTVLVYDLQFRMRCTRCNARDGFEISIFDERDRSKIQAPRNLKLVVSNR